MPHESLTPRILMIARPNGAGKTTVTPRILKQAYNITEWAELLTAASQEAVREALLFHKRNGNSVVGWGDGRVVIVPPEEIVVDPPSSNGDPASPAP